MGLSRELSDGSVGTDWSNPSGGAPRGPRHRVRIFVAAAAGIGVVCVVIVVMVALSVKRQVDQTSNAIGQILEGPQSAPIIVEERNGTPTIVLPLCSGERVDRATVSVGTSTLRYVRIGASPSTSGSIHIGRPAPEGMDLTVFAIAPPAPVAGFASEPAEPELSEVDLRSRLVVTITTSLHRYRATIDATLVSPTVAAGSAGTMPTGDGLEFRELVSVGDARCAPS